MKLAPTLAESVTNAYKELGKRYFLSWRDFLVQSYVSGIPTNAAHPDYYYYPHIKKPVQIIDFRYYEVGANWRVEWTTDIKCHSGIGISEIQPVYTPATAIKRGLSLYGRYFIHAQSRIGYSSYVPEETVNHYTLWEKGHSPQGSWWLFCYAWGEWPEMTFSDSISPVFYIPS